MSALDLTKIKVGILTEQDNCSDFCCGEDPIDEFVHDEASTFQNEWLGVSYLVRYEGKLVGFVTLSMADLRTKKLNTEEREQFPKENIPALQISQLAVCKTSAHNGIGSFLCDWCLAKAIVLSKSVGCRFLILNAKKKAMGFYEKNGFVLLPKQTRNEPIMYLDILKVINAQ